MAAVRREVQALDADQPVFTVRTVDQMLAQATWPYRVFGSLFAIFALIALVLSAVGLYAVMAYSVTQRTAEIGVRMALGARAAEVLRMIVREGLGLTVVGLGIGIVLSFALTRSLQSRLYDVTPTDAGTYVGVCVLLAVVAALASALPALRAARVDPMVALKADA